MTPDDPTRELKDITQRYKVCWDIFPEYAGANHDRKQVGFTIELYGTHDRPEVKPTAGCKHCIPVLQALLSVAEYIVPPAWKDALEAVRARSGLEYAVERSGRPDVVVAATVVPPVSGGAPPLIAQALSEVKARLQALGVSERSWRQLTAEPTSSASSVATHTPTR